MSRQAQPVKKMTDEQCRMVEDNIGLVFHMSGKLQPQFPFVEYEEIVSECGLGIVLAALRFDEGQAIPFPTWACRYMKWTLQQDIRDRRNPKKEAFLEDFYPADGFDGDFQWEDFFADSENAEDTAIYQMMESQIVRTIIDAISSPMRKRIFAIHYLYPELTQKDIAQLVGCSQKNVSLSYQELESKYKEVINWMS